MHNIISSLALIIPGLICFAAFSWGVKGHFRQTGRIPLGTYVISALTLSGVAWFAWRVATGAASGLWEIALGLFACSLALFAWTIKSSRKTPPTLAFDNDEPTFLLHHGPYQFVRHPFYLSYLMFWSATAIASPGLLPWAAPAVMLGVYWHAASREEQKFARSSLATAYNAYRAKAGMFLPRLGSNLITN